MSKPLNKVLKSKDGTETPYSYQEPETLEEAIVMFGHEGCLKMLNYGLSVRERDRAVPKTTDVMELIKNDPELRAIYAKKLAEKREALKVR
jgi:hypothetical protein